MELTEERGLILYIGTYTDQPSPAGRTGKGIYRAKLLPTTGAIQVQGVVAEATNPTFLTLRGDRIYAIGKVQEHGGHPGGVAAAYAIDPITDDLTVINQQRSGGDGPTFISTDASVRVALVAHYSGGSVSSLPIGEGGALGEPSQTVQHEGSGPVSDRQDAAHAHCIIPDKNNRFAFAADLGADKIYQYSLDAVAGQISADPVHVYETSPGSGPRHLAFHPSGRWLYVTGELSSTLIVYAYDANAGLLREAQELSLLPVGFEGENTASEVAVSPNGRFVYAGNRGHDSIAVFRVDDDSGTLTLAAHCLTGGSWPRHFALDPGGEWLVAANQKSDSLTTFRVDQDNGALVWTGHMAEVPTPVCVVFG